MNSESSNAQPFPSELVSPEKKAEKEYGLKLARAVYYNSSNSGSALFYNERDNYRTYIRYALGNQDIEQYKPLLGVNSENIKESMLGSIDWGIRDYATKKINVVVSKITNREFDPVVNAIDQLANDFKKDYKGRIKAFVRDKSWLMQKGEELGTDFTPQGIDVNSIPDNDAEIDIHALADTKLRSEIELEHGLAYHLERNNWGGIRKQIAFDLPVVGVGCVWVGMDENGLPEIIRVRPQDAIAPYTELPDYNNINYGGSIRRMTVGELKLKAGGDFTPEEYETIAEEHTTTSDRDSYNSSDDFNSELYTDRRDVRKVKVLHFEYKTTDEIVHVEKKDNAGNDRFNRKPYDYYRTDKEKEKFAKKYPDRKITRTPYESVYTGYWIVDSDLCFGYKKKEYDGTLGGSPLGYKFFSPNIYDGIVTPMVKQMIPVLNNLQSYNLKIQHTIARAVPKGIKIDLHQLSKVKFKGASGDDMSPAQMLSMYWQTGVLLSDSGGKYTPGATTSPIEELTNGMSGDVAYYLNLSKHSLEELDEITGVNRAVSGSNLHQDAGKSVTEMQVNSAETALGYLYDADENIFNEVCRTLGPLHVQSVKFGGKDKYKNIIGESSTQFLLDDEGILGHDFGYFVEERPSPEDWQRFYITVDTAIQSGQIDISDSAKITDIKNLKEAKLYLQYAVNKFRKHQEQAKQQDIQGNAQVQQQSNEQAHQNALAQEQAKQETIKLQGEVDKDVMRLKIQLETEGKIAEASLKGGYKLQDTEMIVEGQGQREMLKSHASSEKEERKPVKEQ